MTNQEEKPKEGVIFENVVSLLLNCIEHRDIRLFIEIIQDVARRFDYYLRIRTLDIALIYMRDMNFDNGVEIYIVNKYGLEIRVSIFKSDRYVRDVQVSYILVNQVN
jgi:hypothetical protein